MSETTESPAAAAEPAEDPVVVAADLRRRLNEATAGRQAAERAADAARREAAEARTTAVRNGEVAISAQADAVTNAVTAGESRMSALKRDLSAAMQAGDYDKVGDIQGEMSELGANLTIARAEKARMETQRADALRTPPPTAPRPAAATPADPAEAFIATRTEATANWLRQHKDIAFRDGQVSKKLQAAHMLAEDEGHVPDTPPYFKFIEAQLGMNKPPAAAAPQNPSNGQGGRRTAPAAAPARTADYGGGDRPRSGYISPDVVERAEWMGITPQELQAGIEAEERSGGFINGNPYGRR
jgi:hypothetical protein